MRTLQSAAPGHGRRAVLLAVSAMASAATAHVPAETAVPEKTPPEEVVTADARRVDQGQDTPAAITVLPVATLDARNIQSTLQLAPYVPNMVAANVAGLGSANANYIRGIGSSDTLASIDVPIGTFVDGINLPRLNANNLNFFDVDRVEVLRGPQGVLLGRNTVGGAINVVLKRPGDTIAGFGEAAIGGYHTRQIRGSIDLPLAPGIALKLSGYSQTDNGYVHDTTTGQRLNAANNGGLRLAVRLELSEDISWNLSAAYMKSAGTNLLNFPCDPNNPANCSGRFASTGISGATSSYAPLAISGAKATQGLGNRAEQQLYVSNFDWRFGEQATLSLITGFSNLQQRYGVDLADGRALPSLASPVPAVTGYALGGLTELSDGHDRQFSQEIKLAGTLLGGRFDYVTGFAYTNEKTSSDFADIATSGPAPGTPVLLLDRRLDTETNAKAGYFEGSYHLTDAIGLTAGVRYTDEDKTVRFGDNPSGLVAVNGTPIPTAQHARLWTPRFAVDYRATADVLVYASASKGYRSGGWNGRGLTADTLLPFGPEIAWSYELGLKSAFLGDRLRVNLTGFYVDASQAQTGGALLASDGNITAVTQNGAGFRNHGVELEVVARPWGNLSVYATAGYQNASYRVDGDAPALNGYGAKSVARQQRDCLAEIALGQVAGADGAGNAGDCGIGIVTASGGIARPERSPHVTLAGGASYDFKLPAAGIILTPAIEASYRSDFETATSNYTIYSGAISAAGVTYPANPYGGTVITGSHAKGYALVNASLAMKTDDNNWTLALECKNCLDASDVDLSLGNAVYRTLPRTWQLRAKRVF